MSNSKVLIACEESGVVTAAFRSVGIEAFSCDILPTRGNEAWHIQCDVTPLLREPWAAVIAFPPCDHLAISGARWFAEKIADGRQQQGIDFFNLFTDLPHIPYTAIENPVGIMSTRYRKPDQIVHPWWFGDSARKRTCLWLKGFPLLEPSNVVDPGSEVIYGTKRFGRWYSDLAKKDRALIRGQTFPGFALAMATQWSPLLKAL